MTTGHYGCSTLGNALLFSTEMWVRSPLTLVHPVGCRGRCRLRCGPRTQGDLRDSCSSGRKWLQLACLKGKGSGRDGRKAYLQNWSRLGFSAAHPSAPVSPLACTREASGNWAAPWLSAAPCHGSAVSRTVEPDITGFSRWLCRPWATLREVPSTLNHCVLL